MRASLVHRFTAGLVVLCFALFSVEAAVADVHDADGSSSARAVQADGAGLPAGPASEGPQRHDAPGDSGHPVHVCHCTHGHTAGSVLDRFTVSFAPAHDVMLEIALACHVLSRAHPPLVRPPIA